MDKPSIQYLRESALSALSVLREKQGPTVSFSPDEIWQYLPAGVEIPSTRKPGIITWLSKQKHIASTGRITNAVTDARAGSKTAQYMFPKDRGIQHMPNLGELASSAQESFKTCGLNVTESLIKRIFASLIAKRFLILTGLSGSGKTKVAQALAAWLTPNKIRQWEVVAVGSDWTSNEQVIGYPDSINQTYVRTVSLDLILQAAEHQDTPYFLILDEMNLSHVERYFADLLSAIESNEPLSLHRQSGEVNKVPQSLYLPPNLFIIGTVNVDETTYLFSPKVLDRANVIEFRMTHTMLLDYLTNTETETNLESLAGAGTEYGDYLVQASNETVDFDDAYRLGLKAELLLLFDVLAKQRLEFGFRTAKEITKFVAGYMRLSANEGNWFDQALDAQINQKILPKLNGSRTQLSATLWQLSLLCRERRDLLITEDGYDTDDSKWGALNERLTHVVNADIENADPWQSFNRSDVKSMQYPISAEKLARMWQILDASGFVSFTEA